MIKSGIWNSVLTESEFGMNTGRKCNKLQNLVELEYGNTALKGLTSNVHFLTRRRTRYVLLEM